MMRISRLAKKNSLGLRVISAFKLFIVIAASRPVNKNITTAAVTHRIITREFYAVTRAKRGTELSVHRLLASYQTDFGYKIYELLARSSTG